MVPQYTRPVTWLAYWNKFGIPRKTTRLHRPRHRIPGGSTPKKRPRCRPSTRAPTDGAAGAETARFPFCRRFGLSCSAAARHRLCRQSDRHSPAWPLSLRRPEIRAGLRAFRIRKCRCAQGRNLQFLSAELVLQPECAHLQHAEQLRRQGRGAAAHGNVLRPADGDSAGRTGFGLWLGGEERHHFGRPQQLRLRSASAGALSRRHAADGGRCSLHLQSAQERRPSRFLPVAHAHDRGRRDICHDAAAHFLRQTVVAHHPQRRHLSDPVQGLFRGKSVRQFADEGAARLGAVQGRARQGRTDHRIRARRRLLGQGPSSQSRPQ